MQRNITHIFRDRLKLGEALLLPDREVSGLELAAANPERSFGRREWRTQELPKSNLHRLVGGGGDEHAVPVPNEAVRDCRCRAAFPRPWRSNDKRRWRRQRYVPRLCL